MRENELFLRITTEAFGNFSVYNKQEKEIPTCLFQIVTMREGKFSFYLDDNNNNNNTIVYLSTT